MTIDTARSLRERFVTAASQMVGTRFRLHGRDPGFGLDCVGLVAAALERVGIKTHPPRGYKLRNTDIALWLESAKNSGLSPARGALLAGDIVLVSPGPGQHHLLIFDGADSYIHAHAGLGRVSRLIAPLPWPTLRRWQIPDPS